MKKNKKVSDVNYHRAQSMVMQDKFGFDSEHFCKELSNFLSDYFVYDSLTVNVAEGVNNNLVLCVSVRDVKRSRFV